LKKFNTRPGQRYPMGAKVYPDGTNFSVFSRHATSVELFLYERSDSPEPFQVIRLHPEVNRTFYAWHVFVEGLAPVIHYAWRADGPDNTQVSGLRFDKHKNLLDPWGRAVTQELWDRGRASQPGDNGPFSMRNVLLGNDDYDWEDDQPLNHDLQHSIFYEMHVGAFTRHPSSGVPHPGTFLGVIEKIPCLKTLGITDVELMPVMAFDEQSLPPGARALGLKNFWGYSPHTFFSPHPGYCINPSRGTHQREFRDMVKAFHRAGIGVILDVVLNHTAEGGAEGPTINFKGLGNTGFYHLDPKDRRLYRDYTGCGNTVNCSHPVVSRYLVECLEYWVREMHVDGFRFDLASVLVRGMNGAPQYYAPTPWNIEFSDTLFNTWIIAEAWDAGGLYQVGGFPGYRWSEWNGRYRDVIRRFVRGDRGLIGEVATRLSGSSDLYEPSGRLPINSINYITCHDGFTLYDLVSYNEKNNRANGENNRDGTNENLSWNCGHEGPTDDREILSLRLRQAKNFMAILLLSHGVPMILAGDEVLRTQLGNNNAYCQDNELGWFDWTLAEKNGEILRFVRRMIAFRKRHPSLMRQRFLTGRPAEGMLLPDVSWHGARLNEPPWSNPDAQFLAYTLGRTSRGEADLHILLNMSEQAMDADLPLLGGPWYRAIDTGRDFPTEILKPADQPSLKKNQYRVLPRSVVVLEHRD
jgi:isoamylase